MGRILFDRPLWEVASRRSNEVAESCSNAGARRTLTSHHRNITPCDNGLIYVNTRSVDRITTAQSEALSWTASLPSVVSWPPALKKPVKIKLHDRMIRV